MRNRFNWAGCVERMEDERLTNRADVEKQKEDRDGAGRTS